MKLNVTIRNPAPMIYLQEPVSYRLVTIELTDEQAKQLTLRSVGYDMGKEIFEEYSQCFLETDNE